MDKKLAGTLFIRQGVALDYCFEASINSMKAVCDKVFVVYVESTDNTLEVLKTLEDNKTTILFCSEQQWQEHKGKDKLSIFQNVGIDWAEKEGYEYVLLVQADEVLHQDSIPYIQRAMALGEEAYFVSRYNLWGSTETMLNVPQSRKPCSTVVNRLCKAKYRSFDDGEGMMTNGASLDFINLIEIFHVGFVRDNVKHLEKIKEIQGNIFLWTPDERVNLKPYFDWHDWGFNDSDLVPIPKPLPIYLNKWVSNLNK